MTEEDWNLLKSWESCSLDWTAIVMNRGAVKRLPKWASSPPQYEGPQTPPNMEKEEDIEDVVGFLIDSTHIQFRMIFTWKDIDMATKIGAVMSLKSHLKAVHHKDEKNIVERCQVANFLELFGNKIFN